jgi:hypothetical protein
MSGGYDLMVVVAGRTSPRSGGFTEKLATVQGASPPPRITLALIKQQGADEARGQ